MIRDLEIRGEAAIMRMDTEVRQARTNLREIHDRLLKLEYKPGRTPLE